MEKVDWSKPSSLAKLIGTVVSIIGAFVATLFQGIPLFMTTLPLESIQPHLLLQQEDWVTGGLLLTFDCVVASAWLIVQASILKKYPVELTVVFSYFFFAALQSALVSLVMERGPSSWSLTPDFRLIGVLCSAIFGYAFQVGISTWCMHKTGPVFVAMFKPLGIIITVFIGVVFLGDTLYLGSLLGSILIVVGFYSVIWGKAKEGLAGESASIQSFATGGQEVPLLKNID